MIVESADIFIRMVNLPPHVRGLVSPNDDGTYNVYLDPRHSREMQIENYFHEFEHIAYDDFYSNMGIEEIEGR